MLRFGLIFVFVYALVRNFMNPGDWLGYVPNWVTSFGLSKQIVVYCNITVESILVLLLAFNYRAKWAALVSGVWMLIIFVIPGVDLQVWDITFRDFAIATGAFALFFLYR